MIFEARGEIFSVPAENGVIRDVTETSGVAERQDDTYGIVEISDDGPGFAPEYVAAVLERGWRQLSPKAALSLGLALELVDRLGGYTEISVGVGRDGEPSGARVSLFLPRSIADR